MQLNREWIVQELSPGYGGIAAVEAKMLDLGISKNETHISFIILFALISEIINKKNDELFLLTNNPVPSGTWEMILRSISTSKNVKSASQTLLKTAIIFDTPYQFEIVEIGYSVLFKIYVKGKKLENSTLIENTYSRMAYAALCWFSGRIIELEAIVRKPEFYKIDNRGAGGSHFHPFDSTDPAIPSLRVADWDGFIIKKSELNAPCAISREANPILEFYKWFGTISYDQVPAPDTSLPLPSFSAFDEWPKNLNQLNRSEYADKISKNEFLYMKSKIFLSATNKTISEISFNLGFSDEQRFRKFFKTKSGITPTAYRTTYEDKNFLGSDHMLDQILKSL